MTTDRFGNANSAYSFDGINDLISLLPGSNIQGNAPRSISFWIELSNSSQDNYTVYKGGNNSGGNDFSIWLRVNSNNTYQIYLRRFQDDIVTDSIPLNLNQWTHYCVVYDGTINSNIKYYINGIEYTGRYLAGSGLTFNTTATTPQFGDLIDQEGVHHYLDGKLDDIGIWNRALTQQEISNLYNENICYQTITVTDTLIINTNLTNLDPVSFTNTIKIFPNPTNDHITVNYGSNYASLSGYTLKITNSLGQNVYNTSIAQQSTVIDLNSWSGNGVYFVYLIDPQSNIVEVRKIVLQ